MSSKRSPALQRGLKFLRVSIGLLFLVSFLMLIEGPTRAISHDYTQPSYVHHHHHLCHVETFGVGILMWWFLVVVFLQFCTGEARASRWSARLLGFPVLLLVCVMVPSGIYLWRTFSVHDEVTYAAVIGLCNGALLMVISIYLWVFVSYPLSQEREYAWNWLAISTIFIGAYTANFALANLRLPAAVSGVSLILMLYGLYTSKFVLAQKTL